MKKWNLMLSMLMLFSLVGFVSASGNSSSFVDITVDGCSEDLNNDGDVEYSPYDSCLSGDDDAGVNHLYYCNSDGVFEDVRVVANACSQGDPSALSSGFTRAVCCPGGSSQCVYDSDNENGVGNYCVSATNDCSDFDGDEDGCLALEETGQCYWKDVEELCVPRVHECSAYVDAGDCNSDIQGVARYGEDPGCQVGTVIVGGSSIVYNSDDCSCFWNENVSDSFKCEHRQSYTVEDGTSSGLAGGTCTKSFSITEECGVGTVGYESYLRTAIYIPSAGAGSLGLSAELLGCIDETGSRRCGEPIVKVPFFGGFEFLLSAALIGLLYVVMFSVRRTE